ncbi:hypothetical protein EMQ25_14640 [Arsenicitalea aurantiaca]|uniref:N-acyl amino acid synthase FeeM catalytic core domain-containing protein n=1 Tax=Arsenicitalea aurantiaca TaxID=1783274 RepID=A0A433X5M6_9HYPH|nr:hypothetical protein [Arsenicitalea aurantiaca]RUT29354.1 hypothetical protein EMQ25_14640 [Arsenicitalea aurantiaca]
MSAATTGTGDQSRFALTLIDILDRVHYRRVSPDHVFDPVYRLRYEAYRREESVPINTDEIVRDEFDHLPNAQCFGVYIDDKLVSSLRFHHITPQMRHAPSHSVFTDILDPMLDQGQSFIDPGRFTADFEASLAFPALPFLTLRIVVMASIHYEASFCLSSVRPEHVAFYRRVFNSRQLAGARYYHGLSFPMVLYAAEVDAIQERVFTRYPFFMSTREEREAMFEHGAAPASQIVPSARLAYERAVARARNLRIAAE